MVQMRDDKEKKIDRVARKYVAAHTWMKMDQPSNSNPLESYVRHLYVERFDMYVTHLRGLCPNQFTKHHQDAMNGMIQTANASVMQCLNEINNTEMDLRAYLVDSNRSHWKSFLRTISPCLLHFEEILDTMRTDKCEVTRKEEEKLE